VLKSQRAEMNWRTQIIRLSPSARLRLSAPDKLVARRLARANQHTGETSVPQLLSTLLKNLEHVTLNTFHSALV